MRSHSIKYLTAVLILGATALSGQDRSAPTRLTFDPAQEGFPSWSPDGKFLLHSRFSWKDTAGVNGIWKVVLDSKESQQIHSGTAEHPELSPDGRLIVFDSDTGSSISMIEAGGGNPKKFLPDSIIIRSGGLPRWSPSGSQIVFKDAAGSLCVHDLRTRKTAKIFREEGLIPLPCCWSSDGESILFALMNRQTRKSTAWRISADGKEKEQFSVPHDGFHRYLALSPDGSLLVYGAMEGRDLGLWVMLARGAKSLPVAITRPGHNDGPAWSPDGTRLAFASTRSGNRDIWVMDLDVEQLKKELQALDK